MRFEFCGRLDCPDWILAQLFHASRMKLDTFRIICQTVKRETLNNETKEQLDENELFTRLGIYKDENSSTLSSDQLDIDDARACLGAVNFIMSNALVYQVNEKQLANELEQLGLASEHTLVLCETFKTDRM